jgi:hypothetical protein
VFSEGVLERLATCDNVNGVNLSLRVCSTATYDVAGTNDRTEVSRALTGCGGHS